MRMKKIPRLVVWCGDDIERAFDCQAPVASGAEICGVLEVLRRIIFILMSF
jgi:hypothetical protein